MHLPSCIWQMLLSKLTLHSRYMCYQTLLFQRLELMILMLLVLCSTVSATAMHHSLPISFYCVHIQNWEKGCNETFIWCTCCPPLTFHWFRAAHLLTPATKPSLLIHPSQVLVSDFSDSDNQPVIPGQWSGQRSQFEKKKVWRVLQETPDLSL